MAKIPINAVWAENTTNKANMTDEEIGKGIIFESAVESKYPNQALYLAAKALQELQESGALWIENKNYPQGSIVTLMVAEGLFITQRMYIKISDNNTNSFPLSEKSIFQQLGENVVYNIKSLNTTDWQEVGGYNPANLIGDYVTNSKSYQYGENCYIWVNRATNEISLTKPNNPLAYLWKRVLLQSCKDDNSSIPSIETLRSDWMIQDGFEVGHAMIDTSNRVAPLGYLLINQANFDSALSFNDYPRVRIMMDNSGATQAESEWGVFKRINDGTFKLNNDKRGYFMRLFSNGSESIDVGREFQSLQNPMLPNITGEKGRVNAWNSSSYTGAFKSSIEQEYILYGNNYHGPAFWTLVFKASDSNPIYTDNHNDVTPYNFNINLLVKI